MPRIHVPLELAAARRLALPAYAARHVQVLRLQPGDALALFDGRGGEWGARVTRMGRNAVEVEVLAHRAIEREAARPVHLAIGLMATDRMDWLVEKATELGATAITPILAARSSVRLDAGRAARKHARWQAIARAACEQCGRNRVPEVRPPTALAPFLAGVADGAHWLLALGDVAQPAGAAARALAPAQRVVVLSGPEGGLDADEAAAARAAGFTAIGLGARVLRAETAPLAALALLTLV